MLYIGNAFSLGMLDGADRVVYVNHIPIEEVENILEGNAWTSCVGHADTAELISAMLGTKVPMNRCSTSLKWGDQLIVAQYNGPRLTEGATALPGGARLRWIFVTIE